MVLIELKKISTENLLSLLRDVSQEITERLATPIEKREQPVQPVVIIREPDNAKKEYCLHIVQLVRNGEYIRADARRAVAEIAKTFPEWVSKQGLPTESGTWAWKKAAELYSIGFAKER